jgi:Subtilase family
MNRFIRSITLLLFCCTLVVSRIVAQQVPFDAKYSHLILSEYHNTSQSDAKSNYYLAHIPEASKKKNLAKYGLQLCRLLDDPWAIVKGVISDVDKEVIDSYYLANDNWKIADALTKTVTTTGKQYFVVKSMSPIDTTALEWLNGSFSILNKQGTLFRMYCTAEELIKRIVPINEVTYVGQESTNATVESRVLDLNINPNTINKIQAVYPNLSGEGMTLSIKELAYNSNDLDLIGRHVPSSLAATEVDNHATDMATIAAGAGNSSINGKGVARNTLITSSSFAQVLPDEDEHYLVLDTWIQNHSYGTEIENFYGTLAEAFDISANNNPSLLHVFSSGNSGEGFSTTGTYKNIAGYANLTGNFKMAKNVLTVGSVDTVGRAIDFSSRGPAYDGRVKPELVAYSVAGSSNSAALVSGVCVLLQQAYKEKEGVLPSSSLVKALLINAADDVGSNGIDFITGYGNMNSYRSLQTLLAGNYIEGSVSQDEERNYTLSVPANTKNLKITVVWNDKAALPNAATALANDLDIVVQDPNNFSWLPWVLNTSPTASALSSVPSKAVDHLNNVEQILVENPVTGDHVVTVRGFDISSDTQHFSIAYQVDTLGTFEWYFPTSLDNMPYNGETTSYFSWRSTRAETIGRLEYSIDSGNSWNIISTTVDLQKGYFRWIAPDVFSSAIARIKIGNDYYNTDRFSIASVLRTSVGFNCTDSVMLQWQRVANATYYQVHTLGSKFMESFFTTSDTFAIFNKANLSSVYYAVQPVFIDGVRPIRSLTFDYSLQGVDCFLSTFTALNRFDDGIELMVQVGTTYGIDSVVFEHQLSANVFERLGSLKPFQRSITYLHTNPFQGLNVYRAIIFLQNDVQIISQAQDNFYLTTLPVVMFPNPVDKSTNSQLFVFTKNFSGEQVYFTLKNTDGRVVIQGELFSDRETIDLTNITSGLYLCSIEVSGKRYAYRIVVY